MKSIVSQRFVECIEHLYQQRKVTSFRQLALSLDFKAQNLGEIRKGKRDVPIELLRKAIEYYRISPVFIFSGGGPKFTTTKTSQAFDVLTIVTDHKDQERIVHVPAQAQAGYVSGYRDPSFIEEMPSFSLPDMRYRSGSYRSFDVSGQSMEPGIKPHDRLIGRYVEPEYWKNGIRDNHVYILVTTTDVVVKRVMNELKTNQRIHAISDNEFFGSFYIEAEDIKEIWMVESVIRNFNHFPEKQDEVQPLVRERFEPIATEKPGESADKPIISTIPSSRSFNLNEFSDILGD